MTDGLSAKTVKSLSWRDLGSADLFEALADEIREHRKENLAARERAESALLEEATLRLRRDGLSHLIRQARDFGVAERHVETLAMWAGVLPGDAPRGEALESAEELLLGEPVQRALRDIPSRWEIDSGGNPEELAQRAIDEARKKRAPQQKEDVDQYGRYVPNEPLRPLGTHND